MSLTFSLFSPIGFQQVWVYQRFRWSASKFQDCLSRFWKNIFVFQNPRTLITRSVITGKPALKGVPLSRSKRQCFLKHFDKDLLPWGGSWGSGNGCPKVRVYQRFRSSASKKCECISVFAHRLPKSASSHLSEEPLKPVFMSVSSVFSKPIYSQGKNIENP